MLFHFSCPYEKVSKQSTKNIFTKALNYSDKNAIMREKMVVRSLPQCVNQFIVNHFELFCHNEEDRIFRSGFCFRSDSLEALTLLTGK